jgi:hypothetical protein
MDLHPGGDATFVRDLGQPRQEELTGSAHTVGTVGEVSVISPRNSEHQQNVQTEAQDGCLPGWHRKEHAQASQMGKDDGDGTKIVDAVHNALI